MMGGAVPSNICDGYLDKISEHGLEVAYNHISDRLGRNLTNTKKMTERNRPTGPTSGWVRKWETLMYADRNFGTTCGTGTPPGFLNPIAEGTIVSVTTTVDITYGACGNFVYL